MAMTAAGSVVATTAPSKKHTTSGTPASGHNAKPITAVVTRVATIASSRIGAASSITRRTSVAMPGLEDQQWQKHVDEGGGADRQRSKGAGEDIGAPGPAELGQQHREAAHRHTDDAEKYRRRQFQIGGERLAQADDDQQHGDDQQNESGVDHRRRDLREADALIGWAYRILRCAKSVGTPKPERSVRTLHSERRQGLDTLRGKGTTTALRLTRSVPSVRTINLCRGQPDRREDLSRELDSTAGIMIAGCVGEG